MASCSASSSSQRSCRVSAPTPQPSLPSTRCFEQWRSRGSGCVLARAIHQATSCSSRGHFPPWVRCRALKSVQNSPQEVEVGSLTPQSPHPTLIPLLLQLRGSPEQMMITMMLGASSAFGTPIGYQVCSMRLYYYTYTGTCTPILRTQSCMCAAANAPLSTRQTSWCLLVAVTRSQTSLWWAEAFRSLSA